MALISRTEAICDSCRKLFKEVSNSYYCSHCKSFHMVCSTCLKAYMAKCPNCGVLMQKRRSPDFFRAMKVSV